MPVAPADEVVESRVIDVSDVPLCAEVNIDGLEYIRIMRRIGIQDGESVTPVSAFNSSILRCPSSTTGADDARARPAIPAVRVEGAQPL
jgi:hypothetical protein